MKTHHSQIVRITFKQGQVVISLMLEFNYYFWIVQLSGWGCSFLYILTIVYIYQNLSIEINKREISFDKISNFIIKNKF
jgi:hypothetical protein